MRLKLFGTEIQVTFLFAAIITFMLAADRTGLIVPALIAVFLHELGHLTAMWLLGCAPKQVRLIPASVQIVRGFTTRRSKEAIIALMGPAVNLVLFAAFYVNHRAFGNEISLQYAAVNLIIAFFNLLPVTGLDGGTVLFGLLSAKLPLNRAVLTLQLITAAIGVTVLLTAVILTKNGIFNLSLYIIGVYLIIMNLIKL